MQHASLSAISASPFNSMYERIAAELSEEEVVSAVGLLKRIGGWATYSQLLDALKAEHPLCLEADLADLLNHFMAAKRRANIPPPITMPPLTVPRSGSAKTSPGKESSRYINTEDPHIRLKSKWSAKEIDRLHEYLQGTNGRRNWVLCAQHVGTKSSSQCKARYYNMPAQTNNRSPIDL
ncbi:hypothetical protein H4R19_004346 [Coemansia spiralis]|nr:hypothetical protein H4R19_004346 [Coemansia spiralis]